jgi:hypothetical protein
MSIESAITRTRQARRRAFARARLVALVLAAVTGAVFLSIYLTMIRMPGRTYAGPFEPLSAPERSLEAALRADVEGLAGSIGDRSLTHHAGLLAAADYVDRAFVASGYRVQRQRFAVSGRAVENLEAELVGADPGEIVVVGAHYDSVAGTVGADDNGSGVAALLALARAFAGKHPARTLRFVAFANEEPPYFQQPTMGSVVYAKRSRAQGERVTAMLSLETMGYYTDQPGSQHYPFPFGLFYPTVGDFVAFVGDRGSVDLVRQAVGTFRRSARFPSEGIAGPAAVPGIGWSDQWSFWQEGYPGVMITDTAPFRYRHYHETADTPDQLTYGPMARVVVGVTRVVEELAGVR